ncbi:MULTISPECIES: hypothetical protein [Nitrospirillum]|uniref:4-amino-4-deoxy-L-arabinose transferase-like glycosyltransferase n=1 Tax=Nitrospirillum amazonense TaxID=28077 RepID=A0A560F039_9PROT|nr:hypothetical protein [Nitrospirillum amazonense]MEC4594057.1 hypothetical protein [Nitrospirillum amazonense]TWB14996.1 hypothetical protein FBZ88_13230 [Nitrospirillum amazonense]
MIKDNLNNLARLLSSKRSWAPILFFIVSFFAIIVSNWHVVGTQYNDAGDFAANSMLIAKMRSFSLWVGNYSRVGFNHPGPAILYILGLGEFVLYSGLHLVASPLSGQFVGGFLYNAFWLTVLFVGLWKIYRSASSALLSVSIFLILVVWIHSQFLNGLWFPDLYFFPYAAMFVSAARLASGKGDMLPLMGLSCGFLINGHVSFMPMLGFIFIILMLYNALTYFRMPENCLIRKAFYTRNVRGVVVFGLILCLFFVPAAIATIQDFPGPFADYVKYGQHRAPNPSGEVILFISQYWGSRLFFFFAIGVSVIFLIFSAHVKGSDRIDSMRSLAAVMVAATGSVIFYAKYGVDDLSQNYVCLFYYCVSFLFIASIPFWIDFLADMFAKKVLCGVISAVLLTGTVIYVSQMPRSDLGYNQPDIANIYQDIKAHKSDARLTFDLVPGKDDWGYIWTVLAGVGAHAARRDEDLFCVNQNWHILFTKEKKCRPDELEHNPRYLVGSNLGSQYRAQAGDFQSGGLLFQRWALPELPDGSMLTVNDNKYDYNRYILASGWSSAEGSFVFMTAPEAHLTFKATQLDSGIVMLDLGAYLPKSDSSQSMVISVNDGPPVSVTFSSSHPFQRVRVPFNNPTHTVLDVKIIDHDLISPATVGLSADTRSLGVSLTAIGVEAQ